MVSNDHWQSIQNELSMLLDNNAYGSLRPVLEKFKMLIDAQRYNPNAVNMEPEQAINFLNVVKYIQIQTQQGGNLHELVRQVASGVGFNQPDMSTLGNVNQAGRDLIIQIFANSLPNLKVEEPDLRIEIPIVLLAMNDSEANELESEACFKGYPEDVLTAFKQLQALLTLHNRSNWKQHYKETPKEWSPFKDSQENIEWLLDDAFKRVEGYQKKIVPQFVDIRTINTNRRELKKLRKEGCVVIIDVISLRHPTLQRAYQQSLLDAFPNTLVARIDPIRSDMLGSIQQIMIIIEQHVDSEFYKRLTDDYDALCEEVDSHIKFGRWLKDHVTRLLPVEEKVKTGIHDKMYK